MAENVKFELTYAALKLFGKQLYSNVGSAIAELVANGIDANAANVYIAMDISNKHCATVEIMDDGCGMTEEDIRETYIKIGHNKRQSKGNKKNTMLGRKGIGKLAALFLSDCFTIVTKKNGVVGAWRLDVSGMSDENTPALEPVDQAIPDNLVCSDIWNNISNGTYIYLNDVDFDRFGERGFAALESKLSNYFLFNQLGTKIHLNIYHDSKEKGNFKEIDKKIAYKNMAVIYTDNIDEFPPKKILETSLFSYTYKDKLGNIHSNSEKTELCSFEEILGKNKIRGTYRDINYELKGWIGIHVTIESEKAIENDSNYIKNQYYNPNQLRLYVRNKLAMANVMDHLGIPRAFANYIEGEISFDILDDDELEDIATASRQDFNNQDERFILLKELLKKICNSLVLKREKLARKIDEEERNEDKKISSKAKELFSKELHEEIKSIDNFDDSTKAALETTIINKLEGESKLEAKARYTIFISHSSKDRIISDFIFNYLCSLGFNGDLKNEQCEIFYSSSGLDSDNLKPLSIIIRDALVSKNNDILFLTSKNFMASPYCLFEGGAAWATRTIGEYKILSFTYEDIPDFLSNGKSECNLNIRNINDLKMDKEKYTNIVSVINRLIFHLNRNRIITGEKQVELLEIVKFPDDVQLKREGKTIFDYMNKELLEYWDTYVIEKGNDYFNAE